jgi:hypothetical protein
VGSLHLGCFFFLGCCTSAQSVAFSLLLLLLLLGANF